MESDVITLQDIYEFKIEGVGQNGSIRGRLNPTGLRPTFVHKFEKHGLTLPNDLFTAASVPFPRAVSQ